MIAFSGLDGAGKSTQIELLKDSFKRGGHKVEIFWSRGGYTPGMEKLKAILRRTNSGKIPKERGPSKDRDKSFSNPFIRKIWLLLAILDLIYYYSFYIRIKEFFGTKIICDRYIFDTIIDFKLNFPNEQIEDWLIWRLMMLVSIKPTIHFVLIIPVDESLKRSKQKKEPFPDSKEVLEERLRCYLEFILENENVVKIDGVDNLDKIHENILKTLSKK